MSQRRVNETSLTATADALRAKLGTSDPIPWVEGEGFKAAVEAIQTGSGEIVLDATDVKFGSEAIDPDQRYKVGYNWLAQVVDHLQDMVGRTTSFTLEEIVYWLGRVKYIPRGYAESTFTLDTSAFASRSTGILPDVQKGTATSVFTVNTSTFTSSAVGALQEG